MRNVRSIINIYVDLPLKNTVLSLYGYSFNGNIELAMYYICYGTKHALRIDTLDVDSGHKFNHAVHVPVNCYNTIAELALVGFSFAAFALMYFELIIGSDIPQHFIARNRIATL